MELSKQWYLNSEGHGTVGFNKGKPKDNCRKGQLDLKLEKQLFSKSPMPSADTELKTVELNVDALNQCRDWGRTFESGISV